MPNFVCCDEDRASIHCQLPQGVALENYRLIAAFNTPSQVIRSGEKWDCLGGLPPGASACHGCAERSTNCSLRSTRDSQFHFSEISGLRTLRNYPFRTTVKSVRLPGSGATATSCRHSMPSARCILPARGGDMLQQSNHTGARNLEWSCEAISPTAEPCNAAATSHCGICGRWFCSVHAEDETWHICVVEPGEEGGEG